MNILQIVSLGLVSAILITLLKQSKPEIAILLGVAVGIIIILSVADELYEVVLAFYNVAETSRVAAGVFTLVLKIVGIGYLAEFASNVCIDSGCKGVGDKILFAAKVVIMILALPVIKDLLALITGILP